MGAMVSLATAPLSMMATCCGSLVGSCAASMICKACSCYCVASPRVTSCFYVGTLMLFVFLAICFRNQDGDIVIGGSYNSSEASIIHEAASYSAQAALDYWNSRSSCGPAHPSGLVVCCANVCSGVYVVYRFSFTLCCFFAFLTLCTAGSSRFGARAHRGFWFLKAFVLVAVLISSIFVDNKAMEAYRDVARYVAFLFLIMQALLLIDAAYRTNETLVEYDENSDNESACNWKMALLGSSVALYALSLTMWVFEVQWFGMSGCAPQQTIIALTIIGNVALSIISCTRIAPHGTLLTSAVVTFYTTYQCYSALASHPHDACNAISSNRSSAPELVVSFLVFAIAMGSMAAAASSATNSKDAIIGKSSAANSDLTVTLEAGSSDAAADDDDAITAESWWYYHLMMVVVSMYFAMLLSDWSVQPVEQPASHPDYNTSIESFWIKVAAQWACIAMYAWTLLAPYLLREYRDFGVEFDF